jgi:chitin disaccharide deacetylase
LTWDSSTRARRLIVNADDFGYSEHTVDATIECFQRGVLSSATLMPNMPAFERAAAFAREHPQFSYGLHLCLTDERPLSEPAAIPTLVAPNGCFWRGPEFFQRALTGRIAARDIRCEAVAQLMRMKDLGFPVRHLDAHGHAHKAAIVPWALRDVLARFDIATVRRTQNFYYKRARASRWCFNRMANVFIRRLGRTTDYFLMVTGTLDPDDTRWWPACLERLPPGVTEIGIHPGWDEPQRELDTAPLLECGSRYLDEVGVQLINFHELS